MTLYDARRARYANVMKIAIQGERGSFSHMAAGRMVPGCSVVPCALSVEVFDALRRGLTELVPDERVAIRPAGDALVLPDFDAAIAVLLQL